jgi:hypothetical protein
VLFFVTSATAYERSTDDDTIEAGKHARDLIPVAIDERIHDGYPLF